MCASDAYHPFYTSQVLDNVSTQITVCVVCVDVLCGGGGREDCFVVVVVVWCFTKIGTSSFSLAPVVPAQLGLPRRKRSSALSGSTQNTRHT